MAGRLQALASRHRFRPLVVNRLAGHQSAAHLESLFRQHGAPLFLKRANGSPFNPHAVAAVLIRFGVLPRNNPPHFPRYNGGLEKSIRDCKTALALRPGQAASELAPLAEPTAHERNHRPRRRLQGRAACAVFDDAAQRRRWTQPRRHEIFRWRRRQFGAMIGKMVNGNHPRPATLGRVTVAAWLRCQALSHVRPNQNQKGSTAFPKIWSHN